jgi:hypothetical protein
MNALINGADAEPGSYAQTRLGTCGRVISLAPDKLAALADLAGGFARDVRDGHLDQPAVADRLHEVADAYGIIAEHGVDVVQRIIAEGMDGRAAPAEAWPAVSHGTLHTRVPVGHPVTTLDVGEFLARLFRPGR